MSLSVSPTPVSFNCSTSNDIYYDRSIYITDRFFVIPNILSGIVRSYMNDHDFQEYFTGKNPKAKIDAQSALTDLFLRIGVSTFEKIQAKPSNKIPMIRKSVYKRRKYEIDSGAIGARVSTVSHETQYWRNRWPFEKSVEEVKPWLRSLGGVEENNGFCFKAASVDDLESFYGLMLEALAGHEVVVDLCFEFIGISFALPILNVGMRSLKVKKRAKKRKASMGSGKVKKPRVWAVEKGQRKKFEAKLLKSIEELLAKPEFVTVKENPTDAKRLCRNVINKLTV